MTLDDEAYREWHELRELEQVVYGRWRYRRLELVEAVLEAVRRELVPAAAVELVRELDALDAQYRRDMAELSRLEETNGRRLDELEAIADDEAAS